MLTHDKQALVFLPGWGFRASVWEGVASQFQDARLLDWFQKDSEELAKSIPDNSVIVAWSLGSLIAIALADAFPACCSKLVIVAGLPRFVSDDQWDGMSLEDAQGFTDLFQKDEVPAIKHFLQLTQFPARSRVLNQFLKTQQLLSWRSCEALNRGNLAFAMTLQWLLVRDLRSALKKLAIPVSYIFGEKDAIVPLPDASQLLALNPSARIHVIKDAGHAAFLTHSKAFLTCLQETINDDA